MVIRLETSNWVSGGYSRFGSGVVPGKENWVK